MGKRNKLNARLSALEAEFLERLIPALTLAAACRNDLVFLSSRFRPTAWPPSVRSTEAEELAEMADALAALYEQLDIPAASTPAGLYLATSAACYDTANHHKAAPSRFATKLLERIAEARS